MDKSVHNRFFFLTDSFIARIHIPLPKGNPQQFFLQAYILIVSGRLYLQNCHSIREFAINFNDTCKYNNLMVHYKRNDCPLPFVFSNLRDFLPPADRKFQKAEESMLVFIFVCFYFNRRVYQSERKRLGKTIALSCTCTKIFMAFHNLT